MALTYIHTDIQTIIHTCYIIIHACTVGPLSSPGPPPRAPPPARSTCSRSRRAGCPGRAAKTAASASCAAAATRPRRCRWRPGHSSGPRAARGGAATRRRRRCCSCRWRGSSLRRTGELRRRLVGRRLDHACSHSEIDVRNMVRNCRKKLETQRSPTIFYVLVYYFKIVLEVPYMYMSDKGHGHGHTINSS